MLTKEYTQYLKGLLALFIVGGHVSASSHLMEVPIYLRVCNLLTPLALSFYFFFSGYGLMVQREKNQPQTGEARRSYWADWLPRRLRGLAKPYIFFLVLGILLSFLLYYDAGEPWIRYAQLLQTNLRGFLRGGTISLSQGWFVLELAVLYWLFYLTMRRGKSWQTSSLHLLLGVIGLMIAVKVLGYPSYWLRHVLCFVLGVVAAPLQQRLSSLSRRYALLSYGLTLLLVLAYIYGMAHYIEPASLLSGGFSLPVLLSLHLLPIVFLFTPLSQWLSQQAYAYRFSRWSWPLQTLGEISLEVYLVHMIFVNLFRSPLAYIDSIHLYALASFGCSLVSAYLLCRYARSLVRAK